MAMIGPGPRGANDSATGPRLGGLRHRFQLLIVSFFRRNPRHCLA